MYYSTVQYLGTVSSGGSECGGDGVCNKQPHQSHHVLKERSWVVTRSPGMTVTWGGAAVKKKVPVFVMWVKKNSKGRREERGERRGVRGSAVMFAGRKKRGG